MCAIPPVPIVIAEGQAGATYQCLVSHYLFTLAISKCSLKVFTYWMALLLKSRLFSALFFANVCDVLSVLS